MAVKIKKEIVKTKQDLQAEITERALFAIDRIVANRSKGKVTYTMVAGTIGTNASNINRMRAGDGYITVEGITRLCEVYGISPRWVLLNTGDMYGNDEVIKSFRFLEQRVDGLQDSVANIEKQLQEHFSQTKRR